MATLISSNTIQEKVVHIFHFNDVYEITNEPGAARFVSKLHAEQAKVSNEGIVFFSGDAFNPSTLSIILQGEQMVPVLNRCGIHTSVLGNHDFDFGLEKLVGLMKKTNFPWLLGNVFERGGSGAVLGGCDRYRVVDWHGVRLGIMGLVEADWLATLSQVNIDEVEVKDYVLTAKELIAEMKKEGAQIIIALTHMRSYNDKTLAEACPDIDLVSR